MKELFEDALMEVFAFDSEDVITTSGECESMDVCFTDDEGDGDIC
jgi:hypothetical protein